MFAGLSTVVVIVVVMRVLASVVSGLLDTPAWADSRKNGQDEQRRHEAAEKHFPQYLANINKIRKDAGYPPFVPPRR